MRAHRLKGIPTDAVLTQEPAEKLFDGSTLEFFRGDRASYERITRPDGDVEWLAVQP